MPRVAKIPRRALNSSHRRRISLFILGLSLLCGLSVAGFALLTDPDVLDQVGVMTYVQVSLSRERTMRLMSLGMLILAAGPMLIGAGMLSFRLNGAFRRLVARSQSAPAAPRPMLPLHIPRVSPKPHKPGQIAATASHSPSPGAHTAIVRSN